MIKRLASAATAAAVILSLPPVIAAPETMRVTGVRLDDRFRLTGSNSTGLVVSIGVDELKPRMASRDFTLRIFDDRGRSSGEVACLAMKLVGGSDSRWILLDEPTGTLRRSYRALIDSGAAVVENQRSKAIERVGQYEFVYLIGPTVKQGALTYSVFGQNQAGVPVGSFKVPWP